MQDKLKYYMKAGYAGLNVVTHEEQRAERVISDAAKELGFGLFAWSVTNGLVRVEDDGAIADTQEPMAMLEAVKALPKRTVIVLRDFHLFLEDKNPVLMRKLKDTLMAGKTSNKPLVIVSCRACLPKELEKEITLIEFSLPDAEELRPVLQNIAESAGITLNGNTEEILRAAGGCTTTEAENAFALSVAQKNDIVPAIVYREKCQTVKKNGVLEVIESDIGAKDIGGLQCLVEWVKQRKGAFTKEARAYGLPMPKGFLTIGIPGCGKSLLAKATANVLGVPLLRLDAGRIYGSLVGESESNIRSVITVAEAVAPCVLFIDEMEKALAGSKSSGSTDGGTTSRVFGTILQWMNDKTKPVFVCATANDISGMPPELLRKGRWDEIWFVDLPNDEERDEIWKIHIAKNRMGNSRKPKNFDIGKLVEATIGWTGSEIEALFVESLFFAFDKGKEPTTDMMIDLSKRTVPLSKTMGTQIEQLRDWCKNRARLASEPVSTAKAARSIVK